MHTTDTRNRLKYCSLSLVYALWKIHSWLSAFFSILYSFRLLDSLLHVIEFPMKAKCHSWDFCRVMPMEIKIVSWLAHFWCGWKQKRIEINWHQLSKNMPPFHEVQGTINCDWCAFLSPWASNCNVIVDWTPNFPPCKNLILFFNCIIS